MQPQVDALRRGVDIVVATPGRLIDHMERRSVNLSASRFSFSTKPTACSTWASCRRSSASSATCRSSARPGCSRRRSRPRSRRCPRSSCAIRSRSRSPSRTASSPTVTHRVHPVDAARKRDLLLHLLLNDARQTLVFGRTKHGADKLTSALEKAGLRAAAIHGNKSQGAAHAGAEGLQERQGLRARRDRHRRARPRHRAAADGDQFRPADGRRGLRAPHRPHRPRRRRRPRDLAGLA